MYVKIFYIKTRKEFINIEKLKKIVTKLIISDKTYKKLKYSSFYTLMNFEKKSI